MNGDGFDDIIIGSPKADPYSGNEGVTHVVFGFDVASEVTHQGTASGDTLTGTIAADVMVGGLGNDTLVGTGGADVMRGGADNDVLAIQDATFQRIDGGSNLTSGSDTLRLDGAVDLNLTTIANNKITGIEAIDITGAANNTLTLGLQDILDMSDTSNALQIDGNAGDSVAVTGGDVWTNGGTTGGYYSFTSGAAELKIADALYGTTTFS